MFTLRFFYSCSHTVVSAVFNPADPGFVSYTGADASGAPLLISMVELCQQPDVPPIWLPGGALSSAYVLLTQCLAAAGTLPGYLPLRADWGIDRFPCSKTTLLDCFAEGATDLPPAMLELSAVSGFTVRRSRVSSLPSS